MTPKTIDWDMFLGHAFHVVGDEPLAPALPFDRALFAQWRGYWPFWSGFLTDPFVHHTTPMIAPPGLRDPPRAGGAGGGCLAYDEGGGADVGTIVADYDEGCQLVVSSTMISGYPLEEVIRGRLATIKFVRDGFEIIADVPKNGAGVARRLEDGLHGEYVDCHGPKGGGEAD